MRERERERERLNMVYRQSFENLGERARECIKVEN